MKYQRLASHRSSLFSTAAAVSLIVGGTSIPTYAQDDGARLVLEEVLVTATKTEELASEVAISANVMTSRDMDKISANDFTEISKLAPGLDFGSSRDPVSGAIKLRNVGSDSFEGGNDKAVAVFVDGYAQANINQVFATLTDVDRIEVLRGPQGTLYGKNAPAGVISITTRRPDFDGVNGYVKSTLSNYNTYSVEGAVNTPLISDVLAMRVTGVSNESDGFYTNEILDNDSGDRNYKDGKVKFLFVPYDDLIMLLSYRNANLEAGVPAQLYDGQVPFSTGFGPNGGPILADPEEYKTYGSVNRYSDTDIEDAQLTIEWEIGDYTITSLTGHQIFEAGIAGGNDAVPVNDNVLENYSLTRQTTQETRLSNSGFEDLEWLVGIFYSKLTRGGFTQLPPLASETEKVGETWGYFGNAAYYINDQWKVSLGIRYNDEKKAISATTLFGDEIADSANFYQTSGSFKLHYFMTSDIMLYMAIDSAYRSGDFNDFTQGLSVSPLNNIVPGAADFTAANGSFGAEESESFEVGLKGTFMDGRARANITLFHQRFHDYQVNQEPDNGTPIPDSFPVAQLRGRSISDFIPGVIMTVDELITEGVELEGQMLFTENWSGSAMVAYAHATTEEFPNNLCARGEAPTGQLYCDADGARLTEDPLWNATFQLAYENSWETMDYAARLVANYKSAPTYKNGQGSVDNWDDYNSDYVTVDFNFTLTPEDETWSATLWTKNLFDESRPTAEGRLDTTDVNTLEYYAFIPPRTYGITAQYNF